MNLVLNNAKKIRKKLLFFIDTELRQNSKNNNIILIDSKTPKELNSKYQKYSDYCMEVIETYNSNQINDIISNNYFHVAVSYTSLNNKSQMFVENKNCDRVTSNNIVGSYLKVNNLKLKSSFNDNLSFNVNSKDYLGNKKKIVGGKKFSKRRRTLCSSIQIPKKAIINIDENNSDNTTNNNKQLISKLNTENKLNNHNEKNETICAKKKRILKVDYYENKLKKYCSNLIILKKKKYHKKAERIPNSPKKIKIWKKNHTLNPKLETPNEIAKKSRESKEKPDSIRNHISVKSQKQKKQEKNQTQYQNLVKIPEHKGTHKRLRAQSIKDSDIFLKDLKDKNILKKYNSPKKQNFLNINNNNNNIIINSININNKNNIELSRKLSRKERAGDRIAAEIYEMKEMKKMVSGGIKNKRKLFAGKPSLKKSNNNFNMVKNIITERPSRKPLYKRANTINRVKNIFHFKGNEIKIKEN